MVFHRRESTGRVLALLAALAGMAAAWPAAAQVPSRTPRVAALWHTTAEAARPNRLAFEVGLAEAGWVVGRNLTLEHRYTDGRPEALEPLAAELVAARPDVLWAGLNSGGAALARHTAAIPIVIAYTFDPVGAGLVASLARPGGNVTGVAAIPVEVFAKRLQILHETFPAVRRVAILYNADFPGSRPIVETVTAAARSLGLELVDGALRRPEDLAPVFESATRAGGSEAILTGGDNLTFLLRRDIAELALRARLPLVSGSREACEAGALICYNNNIEANFRRSAALVDHILRGAAPADLPVAQPTVFDFVLNQKTARAIGATLPLSLIVAATEIIE